MKLLRLLSLLLCLFRGASEACAADANPAEPNAISYYKQVRPIFQAHCQGCHQPAKASGKYVMTDFAKLVAGGESGDAAIVAGKPDESQLVSQIIVTDGKAEMPKDRPALVAADVELIGVDRARGERRLGRLCRSPVRRRASPRLHAAGGHRFARFLGRRQIAGGGRLP